MTDDARLFFEVPRKFWIPNSRFRIPTTRLENTKDFVAKMPEKAFLLPTTMIQEES